MQAVLTPECLSPSPSRIVRPVFVHGFFIKQANGLSQRCPPPLPGRCATADATVGLMQAVLTPERLSPSPSRTLRPVFVQEFFFSFSAGHSSSLCIHLLVKMISEQRTSPRLRPHPPRPRLPRLQGAIIYMWYSSISAPVTAHAPSQRYNCGGCQFVGFYLDLFSSLTICGAPTVTVGGC
jgi:hypothetical protein